MQREQMRREQMRRRIGRSGPAVSAIGLGCMGMSQFYGPTDDAQSLGTLQAAIDLGVNLIDTADVYGKGHNESLIGKAIRPSAAECAANPRARSAVLRIAERTEVTL